MNKHIGSSVESLFEELGELGEVRMRASKKILAEQFRRSMERNNVSQKSLAKRMATSRTVINRLLDPEDTGVTLATMVKASDALGMRLEVRVRDPSTRSKQVAKKAAAKRSR